MTKTEYNRIKKLIEIASEQVENEAIEEGIDITSVEFGQVLLKVKQVVIEEADFSLVEYEQIEQEIKLEEKAKLKGEKGDSIKGEKGDSVKGEKGDTIMGPQGKEGKSIVGPKGPAGKDSKIPGPQGPKGEKGDSITGPIGPTGKISKKELKKLQKDLKEYILEAMPLSKGRVSDKGGRFWGMADKGSYGTAISDSRYYQKSEVDALIAVENLWDRSGTTLVPQTANDNIDIGSGNFTTTGTVQGVTQAEFDTLTDASDASSLHNHTTANLNDTTATGVNLNTLTDNSIADLLHRHTELVASDGAPDPALSVDASGITTVITLNATNEDDILQVDGNSLMRVGASANKNLFLGVDSFQTNDGSNNIGIGFNAGHFNRTGGGSEGTKNVYIGVQSGFGNDTNYNEGFDNIAIGWRSLYSNSTGFRNFGMGTQALNKNTTGSSNVGIGWLSLGDNTTGNRNFGIGTTAIFFNETGSDNVAIGDNADGGLGAAKNNHSKNTAIGSRSGGRNSTGSSNVFIGYNSGIRQTTNSNLLIIDNQDRASAANEITKSLIYGIFAADPVNQKLQFNATTSTTNQATTLGVGVTTFVIKSNVMTITGDGGANTVATITGANSGTLLTLIFVDGLVTITDDNTHGADSVDLSAAFTSADDTTLQLVYDGVSWYEISRSIN